MSTFTEQVRSQTWYQGCGGKVDAGLLTQLERSREFVAEPKRDGIWVAAFCTSQGVEFRSRTCMVKDYSLSTETRLAGLMLLGELGYGSQESIKRRAKLGHDFMDVFDVLAIDYDFNVAHERGVVRRRELVNLFRKLPRDLRENFRLVPRWRQMFQHRYDVEPEGLILKHVDGDRGYVGLNQRVEHWVKVKRSDTADMVIIGWEKSTANTKVYDGVPRVEHLYCGAYVNGKLTTLTKVGAMTDELSRAIAADFGSYVNCVVELKHFGQFKSGALRHPSVVRIRDDKAASECIFSPKNISA